MSLVTSTNHFERKFRYYNNWKLILISVPVILERSDDINSSGQNSGLEGVYNGTRVGVNFGKTRYISFDSGRVISTTLKLLKQN